MELTLYRAAADFSRDALPALMARPIQNNLFFKNIGDGADRLMAAVRDARGRVLLTAVRTEGFPLLLFETDNRPCEAALVCLADGLAARALAVPELLTEPSLAARFLRLLGARTSARWQLSQSLTLYELEAPQPLPPCPGLFRPACAADQALLSRWYADFVPACGLGDYDLPAAERAIAAQLGRGGLWVWENGGRPVSMAAAAREAPGCRFVSEVYTPPAERGRGYARACVGALSRRLLAQYGRCALYADCANPAANAVYQRIGYRPSCRYDHWRLLPERGTAEAAGSAPDTACLGALEGLSLAGDGIALRPVRFAPADPARGRVPAWFFEIVLPDGTAVGTCDLRLGDSDSIRWGGHIGYAVEAPHRGHRYAARACRVLFALARELGMTALVITCDPDNLPSRRTCERLGGSLTGVRDLPPESEMYAAGRRRVCVFSFALS